MNIKHSVRDSLRLTGQITSEFCAYLTVRSLVAFVQVLPYDMGDSMCRSLAWFASDVLRIRHETTEKNLRSVFPDCDAQERRRISFAMWHHLLLMVCEIAWAQRRLHLTNWSEHVRFKNNKTILRALLVKRPAVMVSGHYGNFEIGGYTMGLMGCSTTTIARKLDNRFLHAWVKRFRGAKGQSMVDKEGCAPLVDRHLQNGGTLSLLADQHAGPKGCWVDFMGVPASCHKALALFSLTAQAPMFAGYTRRINGQPMQFETSCTATADPANDPDGHCDSVTTLTQWYNHHLAQAVALSVEQYWWLHRRWRDPPEKVAKRLEKRRRDEAARAAKDSLSAA
ncbi:MAG: lysophospholipid acyltransferase family protein [Pirellulaceae bacterium]|nr:lysophospholipid acyltransferase family protein [Pirellulaceae bacterium]